MLRPTNKKPRRTLAGQSVLGLKERIGLSGAPLTRRETVMMVAMVAMTVPDGKCHEGASLLNEGKRVKLSA
jgi:hypothetical protein